MGKLQLNIPAVLDAAKSAGASPSVIEGLYQRLLVMNADNAGNLIDERATMALKVVDRQSGCIWEGKDMTEEEIDSSRQATLNALWHVTELPLFIMVGQWSKVADFLEEHLTGKPSLAVPLTPANDSVNEQIANVAAFMRTFRRIDAPKPRNFIRYYNAHRVACVLSCPLSECAQNFNCWETRRSFCRLDAK